MSLLSTQQREGIVQVALDNPPVNLVTVDLTRELGEVLDNLAADASVRVLVLTGAGRRAFCAGSDIREFADMMSPGVVVERKLAAENAVYTKLARFPRPTVAAINGAALGGGLELAVCCDLLVAAEDVSLGFPEVRLGVFPGSGGPARVARRVGDGRTRELMLLGEPITAHTALQWGLINRVAPSGGALDAALEIASRLAELAPGALALCKRAIGLAFEDEEAEAIRRSLDLSDQAFAGGEIREGVRAFLAREKPRFR